MILYCDTSALIKLYLTETASSALKKLAGSSEAVATCRVTWAEAHAALARRVREVPGDAAAISEAKLALASDWPKVMIVELTQGLVERAADYADTFALRGYDSVQLAAAHSLALEAVIEVTFACFDDRLSKAAKILGLRAPFGVAAGKP